MKPHSLRQTLILVLLLLFLLSPGLVAQNSTSEPGVEGSDVQLADFLGTWTEYKPWTQRYPMRLKFELKSGRDTRKITVWVSYTDDFDGPFAEATFKEGQVVWEATQGCAPRFRHAGYNYDKPGLNTFRLSVREQTLRYEQKTRWYVPCDGHPAGEETIIRRLSRTGAPPEAMHSDEK